MPPNANVTAPAGYINGVSHTLHTFMHTHERVVAYAHTLPHTRTHLPTLGSNKGKNVLKSRIKWCPKKYATRNATFCQTQMYFLCRPTRGYISPPLFFSFHSFKFFVHLSLGESPKSSSWFAIVAIVVAAVVGLVMSLMGSLDLFIVPHSGLINLCSTCRWRLCSGSNSCSS